MCFTGLMKKVLQLLLCFSITTYLLPAAHPHVLAITVTLPGMEHASANSTSTPLTVAFPIFFPKLIISFRDFPQREFAVWLADFSRVKQLECRQPCHRTSVMPSLQIRLSGKAMTGALIDKVG